MHLVTSPAGNRHCHLQNKAILCALKDPATVRGLFFSAFIPYYLKIRLGLVAVVFTTHL